MLAIAVALPLAGLVGYGVYRQFLNDREHALHDLVFLQQINGGIIQQFLDKNRSLLARLVGDSSVQERHVPAMEDIFLHVVQGNPAFADIRALDPAGRLIATAQPMTEERRQQIAALPAYVAAARSDRFQISPPYQDPDSRRWHCLLTQPVLDAAGQRVGTLAALLRLEEFAGYLNLPPNGVGLAVGIIDRSGLVALRRPDPGRYIGVPAASFPAILSALERGEKSIQAIGLDGEPRTTLVTPVAGAPWIAITSVPTHTIYRSARRNLWQTLVVASVILVLGAYLVARYANTIEAPIKALADAARDQTAGRTEHLAPVTGPAEVAETARAFNEMVAARRQAEELLVQSEKRYRTVIDQTGQMVYDLDLVTNVPLWFGTEAVPAITGYSLAEFQSVGVKRWEEMIHPDDRARAVALLERTISSGAPYVAEYRFRRKDGSYRHIEDYGVCLRDADGRLRRLLGRMSDVTARRHAEQALRESEERLRTIIAAEPECVKVLDPAGQLLEMNPAGLAMIEAESLEVAKRHTLADIVAPEHHAAFGALHRQVMAGNAGTLEFRIVALKGTERWLETHAVPLRNEAGAINGLLGITRDITLRRKAEEEHRLIGRKLQETQKLESLGVLAGGIAHDFNNLLTGVLGNVGLARLEAPPGWVGADNLAQIEKAALRAADLCKQMLAYSGKGRFIVQPISLNELLEETTHLLQISISKKATLQLTLDPALPAISADATQVRQVVMNLVINASEALGDRNGQITVTTGRVTATPAYLATVQFQTEIAPGEYVFLEVGDNGCGMDRETLARIFDPFFTTKFTGRGLGLAAVLGIVRGHKGAIKVYSEPGRGTTFRVLLPPVSGAPQPLNRPGAPAPEWRGQGHVLVIDDEESVRNVARSVLVYCGFTVEEAADGATGVALFSGAPQRFTAVLLDLTMPQMDGEEAFRQLRLLNPGVCVVLMSGFNRVDAINRFVGKGLAGFVQKPFEVQTLVTELSRVLKKPSGQS
ncbi:MAG: hypothetical protein C0502_01210 [Opitutus sp.]|nr:hypothetical protein [Opitutus sp.]